MRINKTLRKKLLEFLPKDYRKIIVDRLAAKGTTIHANTVSNALNGTENDTVVLEIIKLHNEEKAKQERIHKELDKNLKQLSAA
jgi:mRNA-degrading endonuclease RelE of RelBE toxin-antitoxin system